MIINTGQRTDIPAFYAEWFANRLREGFVCVRNPYNPSQVSRYRLDPTVVDVIGFCTKNPAPMFPYMDLLKDYGQYWFMTITPYGRDMEPNVPDKHRLLEDFKRLSDRVGVNAIGWRYDPILLSERYTTAYHLRAFETMASALEGCTQTAVISFIDLYPKVRRNFPEAREVRAEERIRLGKALIEIASAHGMIVKPCAEGDELAPYGADCGGCMRLGDYEKAIAERDERIAALKAQVADAAKNAEAAEAAARRDRRAKAQGESDRIDPQLQFAGVRNVKAARAILADCGGDVDALKEAEPWLFADAPPSSRAGGPGSPTPGPAQPPARP